jgi:catalase
MKTTREGQSDSTLTTRQGHPVGNNQSQRTVGSRGPATLENYHFLDKITHFDRERIPERVVHARGFVCYGEFEASGKIGQEPASKYTRAKLFQTAGKLHNNSQAARRSSSGLLRGSRSRPQFAEACQWTKAPWQSSGSVWIVIGFSEQISAPTSLSTGNPTS